MRVLLVGLRVMGIISLIIIGVTVYHLTNTILPGVYVQNIDVSGLTTKEATAFLTRTLPKPETLSINVQIDGKIWALSWSDVGQRYDIDATVQAAYAVGRNTAGKASMLEIFRNQNVNISPVTIPASSELVKNHIAKIAKIVERAPVNASFSLNDGTITATTGQPGRQIDIETSVTHVLQALTEGTYSVELTAHPVTPTIVEPEPARTQAQAWLAEPFTLIITDTSTEAPPESATTGEGKTEFVASPERISTWLEPQIEGQGIGLRVLEAPIQMWLEEINLELGAKQPLEISPTLQSVLTALTAGQHFSEASIGPPAQFYTVQIGDTLSDIALAFGTTVDTLKTTNGLSSDLIVIGEILRLPNGTLPQETPIKVVTTPPTTIEPPPASTIVLEPTPHSEEWREDLATLTEELNKLPEVLNGAFSIVHNESFVQAITSLDARIPGLADNQIIVGIMQILALLGDAHTGVNRYRWEAFQEHAYPIELQWFQDGLFVTAVQPGYEDLLELELIQIGGTSIAQVMNALALVIPHENPYGLRAASTNYMLRPVILHALGLATDLNSAAFTFQNTSGNIVTRYLVAASPTAMQDQWVRAVPYSSGPLYIQKLPDTYYWATYLESEHALYFQYNRCAEQSDVPFDDFLNSLSHIIATQPVDKYIIDLRHNPGGSPGPPALILDHVLAHPQFTQQKKLFVLTGNHTFSSGVYLTSLLEQKAQAILIGEPTGQGANFYASPKPVRLPNSGLTVNLSYSYWEFADVSTEAIQPDILVPLSSWEYFAGRDPVLQTALAQP